eukprot:11795379-Ditylum_brightwellii.AAC.1
MAPTMQGVCSKCKTSVGNIVPPHHKCSGSTILVEKVVDETWERRWRKKGECMGSNQRRQFVPFKANIMASKGTSLPLCTKGGRRVGTYLGGGRGNKKDVFLVVAAINVFVVFVQSLLCVAGSILTQ